MSPRWSSKENENKENKEEVKVPEQFKVNSSETSRDDYKKVSEKTTPQTFVVKTEIDAYVNERLQTQPASLDGIEFGPVRDSNEGMHQLTLPKEVREAFEKRGLSPRWINKDKKMIDRALNIRGWLLVNRVYFPELKTHLFTANGTIENGDSILGFMPAERAEKLRHLPGKKSQERINNLPIEKYKNDQGEKIGYYKPVLSAEKDGEMVVTGIQPDKVSEEQ